MIRLAVLGDPVDHSLSPRLHAAALRAAGIEGAYEARRVDTHGLSVAAEELRRGILHGANITMPHKRLAARLSDRLEGTAAVTGSVNTWVYRESDLIGYSTDDDGVRFAIAHAGLPDAGPVLVLGAGGAARAAIVALRERPLFVTARRAEAANGVVGLAADARVVPWGTVVEGALVVNATPLGMSSQPLPKGVVESAGGLLDMVYGERMTPAVATAQRLGIPASDGLPMLVGQAAESFRLWTGHATSPTVMMEAANASSSSAARPK